MNGEVRSEPTMYSPHGWLMPSTSSSVGSTCRAASPTASTVRHDALVSIDDAEHLHHNIPNSRLEIIDDTGDLINVEAPDKFLGAVRRGRERLHERSQETVVAGIGPLDRDGAAPDVESYQ